MKNWTLFLDDMRVPADVRFYYPPENEMVICRNYDEAVSAVEKRGIPNLISFDHDLADEHYDGKEGHEKTGYSFAKWFCNYVVQNDHTLPLDFGYHIHSMNPVGAENIRITMYNFMKYYRHAHQ